MLIQVAEWTAAMIAQCITYRKSWEKLKEKERRPQRAYHNQTNLGWHDWDKQLDNYFAQKRGVSGIPLHNEISDHKPNDCNPIVDAMTMNTCCIK